MWLAVQSLSQLEVVYGKARAQVLRDNMGVSFSTARQMEPPPAMLKNVAADNPPMPTKPLNSRTVIRAKAAQSRQYRC